MKKTLLLLLITLCVLTASAQKSILFKMKYMPLHNYVSAVQMDMNMEMDIKADSATLAKITASGQKLPMLMKMKSDMGTTMKVGAKNKDNVIPILLNYDKVNSTISVNGNTFPTPASPLLNKSITGKIANETLQLDSVSGKVMSDEQKKAITSVINNMLSQIKFPDKPLSIGESFTQEIPMNFPVAGNNMEMAVKVIYKLVSIKDNIAFFDIDQSLSVDMTSPESALMKMNGSGNGKMEYNITDSFFKKMTSNLEFSYNMDIKEMHMTGKADMVTTYSVNINKAN